LPERPLRSIGRFAPLLDAFGWAFLLAWTGAVLAFPLVKGILAGYLPVMAGLVTGAATLRFGPRVLRRIDGMPTWLFLGLAVGLAATLRAMAVGYFPREPMVDDAQFHRYAVSMAQGGGYGAPGVLAFFPPGMSFILAAWYFLTTPSPLAGKMLQLIFGCLVVWQTWAITRQFLSERTARVAALLVAIFPSLVFYTSTLGYEIVLGLILLVTCRLVLHVAGAGTLRTTALVALGALLGLGALVKPIGLLVPVLCAVAWWMLGANLREVAIRTVIVMAIMLSVVSPWTLRNYRVVGAFVPISTNGGQTLYAANNPRADGLATAADPIPGESDEVSRDRLRMKAALSWIRSNPGRWCHLALVKATYTWGTSSTIMSVVSTDRLPPRAEAVCKAVLNVGWVSLLVWCVAATIRHRPWAWPVMVPGSLVIAYVFGLHLFYEANSRHHLPVIPLLCMVAATAMEPARCES
jgi:hypothetical protein